MKATIKRLAKESIAREETYIKEHNEVLEILKPLEGKPINGRTLNAKRLGKFKLKTQYGMYHICGNQDHLIGYVSSSNLINIELFEKWDACNGSAAQERIEKIKRLDLDEFAKIGKKISKAFNELRFLFGDLDTKKLDSYNNPIYYDMLKSIFDENDGRSDEIQLHKFHYIRKYRNQ